MIVVTRLNGLPFALNPDLIERADATPDTVVTLAGGNKYVICESLSELTDLVRAYRASVISTAHAMDMAEEADSPPTLRVVPSPKSEG
ncbi:MAG: flagellar FlbD family protein [Actinomycetota bacterium]|nr:flagellar FlbD family protein [Actinomycetota bacterium]